MLSFRFNGFLILCLWIGSVALAQFQIPSLRGPVMDEVGILRPQMKKEIEQVIREVNQRGVAQIQVLIVSTLQGESIEGASIRIVEQWKLGDIKKDNGVLFLIAVNDKKMRIEVGQGLEGAVPDVIAKRIISDRVAPFFRSQNFSEGVRAGVYSLIQYADKEFSEQSNISVKPSRRSGGGGVLFILLLILFSIVRVFSRSSAFRSHGSGWGSGSGAGGFGGFGGRGGFGGGGGGGWSGGGGGFSGGGASGDW